MAIAASLPLAIWDTHNQRVIVSMGMAWDMGAPIWPFQTPDIILRFANLPAYLIAQPFINLLRWYPPRSYVVVFPAYVLWWWFIGARLDSGLVKPRQRNRWLLLISLMSLSILLMLAALITFNSAFRWWFQYGRDFPIPNVVLMMVRFLTPTVWAVVLALLAAIAAKRVGVWDCA